jgi:predicted  nucleic acid-binding Zn-ribbon protein
MIVKSIREIKEINNIIISIRNLFNDPVILKNLEKINLTREAMKNAVENTKNTMATLEQTDILYESKKVVLSSKKIINLPENAQNLREINDALKGLRKSFRELINELKFTL